MKLNFFFYHNLYKSNDKKADCDFLFVNIRGNTQKLNEEDKYSVDDELFYDVELKQIKNG